MDASIYRTGLTGMGLPRLFYKHLDNLVNFSNSICTHHCSYDVKKYNEKSISLISRDSKGR